MRYLNNFVTSESVINETIVSNDVYTVTTSTQTDFLLSERPRNAAAILVTKNGLALVPDQHYTLTEKILSLVSPAVLTDKIEVRYFVGSQGPKGDPGIPGTLSGTTDQAIITSNTTNSTSATTGALVVAGGAGISSNLYVTGNVVLPVTPLYSDSNFNNVALLLHLNNSLTDQSNSNISSVSTTGAVEFTNTVIQYGTHAIKIGTATNSGIVVPANPALNFGTNDFTIEFWAHTPSLGATIFIGPTSYSPNNWLKISPLSSASVYLRVGSGYGIEMYNYNVLTTALSELATGYRHIAVTRSGTNFHFYVNGQRITGGGSGNPFDLSAGFNIGLTPNTSTNSYLYLDEIRFTNGLARYTSNFAPPTLPFPDGNNLVSGGTLRIEQTISSTSTTTGALTVAGGVGVTGNVNASAVYTNNYFYANGTSLSTSSTFTGGTVANPITITNTTDSTSPAAGALIVGGGIGVTKSITAGGTINVTGAATFSNTLAVTGNTTIGGLLSIQQISELLNTKTNATGIVTHDYSTGAIFYHSAIGSNFTLNITNLPTTNDQILTVTLILSQGSTGFLANQLQINGVATSFAWADSTAPSPTVNAITVQTFTLIIVNSLWQALTQIINFGA